MKYLSDYVQTAQSALFEKTGMFFAYSPKQYAEAAIEGVEYVSLGGGMLCPKPNVDELIDGLTAINTEGIRQDLAENGKHGVIKRELYNHECFYTGDDSDAVEKLEEYGITAAEVRAVYIEEYSNAMDVMNT